MQRSARAPDHVYHFLQAVRDDLVISTPQGAMPCGTSYSNSRRCFKSSSCIGIICNVFMDFRRIKSHHGITFADGVLHKLPSRFLSLQACLMMRKRQNKIYTNDTYRRVGNNMVQYRLDNSMRLRLMRGLKLYVLTGTLFQTHLQICQRMYS